MVRLFFSREAPVDEVSERVTRRKLVQFEVFLNGALKKWEVGRICKITAPGY